MLNNLQTREDLADFLGITSDKLEFFIDPPSLYSLYRRRLVPKRSSGYRELLIPRHDLRRVQKQIAAQLGEYYRPLPCVHGFTKGRSIRTNAEIHIGSQVIVGIDIKDFFPSISPKRVYGLLKSKELGLSSEVAFCLSRLLSTSKGLPQGAPSSPIISNMICVGMDKQLMYHSHEYRYRYSRYADDLTFSFESSYFFYHYFYAKGKLRIPSKIRAAINDFHGHKSFELNEDKSFYSCNFSRQLVTGVVCNKKTNIKREQYRRLRSTLHHLSLGHKDKAMGCYYGKPADSLSDEEKGLFDTSLRGSLDFYKSLIKDPWASGPLMRLGSLYNQTKAIGFTVFPIAFHQDAIFYIEGEDCDQMPFEGLGFYLKGYGMMTAWHVISDAAVSEKGEREIKISSAAKEPLAVFRFGESTGQANLRDGAVLKDVPAKMIKAFPTLSADSRLPSKGDTVFAYQFHHSSNGFSFERHRGESLDIGALSEYGLLCKTNCLFQHGMSGGPVFNEFGLVVGIVHSATEDGKLGSFLALEDCINSTDVYGKWQLC